jgi:Amt family ammonium transporter
MDFSGSAYVHSIGGSVALAGSIFLGARLGRFNSQGQPVYRGFKPYSYSTIGLGCLLLWTGWCVSLHSICTQKFTIHRRYAFNSLGLSSVRHLSNLQISNITGRSSLVTTLGGASGILGACLYSRIHRKTYEPSPVTTTPLFCIKYVI